MEHSEKRVLLSSLRNDRDMARSLAKRLDQTIKILEEEENVGK